jgi:hypothetical protein
MKNAPSPIRNLFVEDRVLPATAFAYLHCDVPASMTLAEWRRTRNRARPAAEIERRRERRAALLAHLRRGIGQR